MGGKSGGGARTPYEAPNTLQSAQRYKAVHVLAEGELAGFAGKTLLQSIYFNGTPIQDSVGNFNFRGVEVYALSGTANQPYVPGFDTSENTVSVGAEVKKAVPVTRTVTDPLISRLRVTVAVERNIQVQDNGDHRRPCGAGQRPWRGHTRHSRALQRKRQWCVPPGHRVRAPT